MRPGWAGATGRSGTSGGYTERVEPVESAPGNRAGVAAIRDDRHLISERPLDPLVTAASVSSRSTGGLATFVGLVRDHNAGRQVLWIDYEAHAQLAAGVFTRIAAEAREHWPGAELAIHHRIGRVSVGEASVVVCAASPHRAEAFAACRFGIERVKQIAPIWKHEHFEGGAVWIEGALADPDDEAALKMAVERACS
jgi:molybdopterin synthase catalytic subunit